MTHPRHRDQHALARPAAPLADSAPDNPKEVTVRV
jgi:hypothetical protein